MLHQHLVITEQKNSGSAMFAPMAHATDALDPSITISKSHRVLVPQEEFLHRAKGHRPLIFTILLRSGRMKVITLLALTGIFILSGCAETPDIEGAKLPIQSSHSFDDATYEISQEIPEQAITLVVEYVDALNFALSTGDLSRFNKSAKSSCTCLKPAIGIQELYRDAVVVGGRYEITQLKPISISEDQITLQLFLERSNALQLNLESGVALKIPGVASSATLGIEQIQNNWQIASSSL
jgi:hypothetical protein